VHSDLFSCFASDGVECVFVSGGTPFIFVEAPVILGVNDGEFALRERDFSERVTAAETAVGKQKG